MTAPTAESEREVCELDGGSPLLTPDEVAARLRCSVRTAKRVMAANRPVCIGRLMRWPLTELVGFLARGGMTCVRGRR